MDTSRNHVVADINSVPEEHRVSYTPVPKRLQKEAKRVLADRTETYVDINSKSPLRIWADKVEKRRKKNKLSAKSRKQNRSK